MASPHHTEVLAAQPDAALFFILGMLAARPLRPAEAGRLAAICTEVRRRGLWDVLCASIDRELAAALAMLETADRGQHFASTGQRRRV